MKNDVLDGIGDFAGRRLEELPTPFVAVDVHAMERNMQEMSALCRQHGKLWRPHIKAHRCPQIIQRLQSCGWTGMTCATVTEAQVAVACGVRDVLIANQLAHRNLERGIRLARVADPILTFDHPDLIKQADEVAASLGVRPRAIVELDIGMQRAGASSLEEAEHLAERIERSQNLVFAGIMGYEGHLLAHPDAEQKRQLIFAALDLLGELAARLRRKGINCEIVSAGGTGSCEITVEHPAVTELQAGGLIFMDAFYRRRCGVNRFEYALTVESRITSRPSRNRAIMDAGRKTHDISLESPFFLEPSEGVTVRHLSAEHGVLDVCPESVDPRPGDRVRFVPGYSDFTLMLHRSVVAHSDGVVVGQWLLGPRAL